MELTVSLFFITFFPVFLTCMNLYYLFKKREEKEKENFENLCEWMTLLIGTLYSLIYMSFLEIDLHAPWYKVLVNSQRHQPIEIQLLPILLVILGLAFFGYLNLKFRKPENTSPLAYVLYFSLVYLGLGIMILWMIQVKDFFLLLVFPINVFLIGFKVLRMACVRWTLYFEAARDQVKPGIFLKLNQLLSNAKTWPMAAFIFSIPLLILIIGLLLVFGQRPDSIIRAWTETSDWSLSTRIAPQNIQYDEHYLCTVAAGGHSRVVKPLRKGVRHHHEVIVNRQLCVANAFEAVIQEKLPRMHRMIRKIYDTYGYPVARHIHSKIIADIVYIAMKPLEWWFVIILYCVDVNPENRIATQYITKPKAQL